MTDKTQKNKKGFATMEFMEESEKSFETLPIKDWLRDSWVGFYKFLENELLEKPQHGSWEYIPNPDGGFLGFWWHFEEWKGHDVYLQIEEDKLCFKISKVSEEKRSDIRNEWHSIIMSQADKEGKSEIQKPHKFGFGESMTVAIIERKNWLGADGDILNKENKEKVIKRLREYEKFLNRCLDADKK